MATILLPLTGQNIQNPDGSFQNELQWFIPLVDGNTWSAPAKDFLSRRVNGGQWFGFTAAEALGTQFGAAISGSFVDTNVNAGDIIEYDLDAYDDQGQRYYGDIILTAGAVTSATTKQVKSGTTPKHGHN